MATVSACVPVFAGEAFVERTLESLCAQTHTDIEILVSVDHCEDDSGDICARYAKDPRFEIVNQPRRLGLLGNVEFLLNRATSEFVFIMPHDDWIEPQYVEVLFHSLQSSPQAIVAYCDIDRFGTADGAMHQATILGSPIDRALDFLRHHINAVAFRGLMRRAWLSPPVALPRNNHEDFAADVTWLLFLACRGEFRRVPEVLYHKRIHDASQNQRWNRHDQPWRMAAWFEHCVACAEVVLAIAKSDTETTRLIDAILDRLTMPQNNLWPPSGIHELGEAEKNRLRLELLDRLRHRRGSGAPDDPVQQDEPSARSESKC